MQSRVDPADPDRALNKSWESIARSGAVFNINEGILIEGKRAATRLVAWPGVGTRMVAAHTLIHLPGGGFEPEVHPLSEECLQIIKGHGQVDLGRGWIDLVPGDIVYVPHGVRHATRTAPDSSRDFVAVSFSSPPQMDLYQKIGFFRNGLFDFDLIERELARSTRGDIPTTNETQPSAPRGPEWGEVKGPARTALEGGIFNMYRGAPFRGNGSLMKFILWPGAGTRMISAHTAFHDPGTMFIPHIHPISEDAILCTNGKGQGHLHGRWIDVEEGDIVYGPDNVKHGTGCPEGFDETFYTTGCASPPQPDLYERAGYFVDGRFVDFPVE